MGPSGRFLRVSSHFASRCFSLHPTFAFWVQRHALELSAPIAPTILAAPERRGKEFRLHVQALLEVVQNDQSSGADSWGPASGPCNSQGLLHLSAPAVKFCEPCPQQSFL